MTLQFIDYLSSRLFELLVTTQSGTIGGLVARWVARRMFGGPSPSAEAAALAAIDKAQDHLHSTFGDRYGAKGSTFIDRNRNQGILLRSTFPRSRRLIASDIDPRGFDDTEPAPSAVVEQFLGWFYESLDVTESRELDRDRSIQDLRTEIGLVGASVGEVNQDIKDLLRSRILPEPIRTAIAEPAFAELRALMKSGRAEEAIDFVKRRTDAIDTALDGADPDRTLAEALRTYRQRLMLAAASAEGWLGNVERGREWWRRANDLGPIDPERYLQAGSALFNLGLANELRQLMSRMPPESARTQGASSAGFFDER